MYDPERPTEEEVEAAFNEKCLKEDEKLEEWKLKMYEQNREKAVKITKVIYDRLMARITKETDKLSVLDVESHLWYARMETLIKEELIDGK